MKQVPQLNSEGYFVGFSTAFESPLEPGVFLIPAGCLDVEAPVIKEGMKIKWDKSWIYEEIESLLPHPQLEPEPEVVTEPEPYIPTYADLRALEYPPMWDYLDGIVKNDKAQIEKYIAECLAVKAKYPKPV